MVINGDFLLVELKNNLSSNGIVMHSSKITYPNIATVKHIGNSVTLDVKVGDIILFNKYNPEKWSFGLSKISSSKVKAILKNERS